jgi:alkanesulfonate monooxygenase
VDAYLTWGEPPAAVKQKIEDVRERAAKQGRTVIRRRTPACHRARNHGRSWADAERLISKLTDEDIAAPSRTTPRWIQ